MFKCLDCKHEFDTPDTYEERHGLDTPPYESVAICPECKSTEFTEWESAVEKSEVTHTIVNALAALNRLHNNIDDIFNGFKNDDIELAQGLLSEFIIEMYDEFIPSSVSNSLLKATTKLDVDRIILKLEG